MVELSAANIFGGNFLWKNGPCGDFQRTILLWQLTDLGEGGGEREGDRDGDFLLHVVYVITLK